MFLFLSVSRSDRKQRFSKSLPGVEVFGMEVQRISVGGRKLRFLKTLTSLLRFRRHTLPFSVRLEWKESKKRIQRSAFSNENVLVWTVENAVKKPV